MNWQEILVTIIVIFMFVSLILVSIFILICVGACLNSDIIEHSLKIRKDIKTQKDLTLKSVKHHPKVNFLYPNRKKQ